MKLHHALLLILALLVSTRATLAADVPAKKKVEKKPTGRAAKSQSDEKEQKDKKDEKDQKEEKEKLSITRHTATIQDNELKYIVTAGKLVMKDEDDKPKALIFFVAYSKDGVKDSTNRPVTFAFNGGPGSSSVWLHLGLLGPKYIKFPDQPTEVRPPYKLSNNARSLLDLTDLVFIDPVSTGFSRPAKDEDKGQFHGYDEDLRSVGQFIHNYLSKYNRWRSPKFLIGESYGGLRAAGLSGYLSDRYNMPLNGIVLVSPALNFETIGFSPGNDLPYALFLPSYATTAWYHKALSDDLQKLPVGEVFKQAKTFADNDYTLALMQGFALSEKQRNEIAEKLANFTGLSKSYVQAANLRISMWRFAKELLRKRGLTVGRYDSRFTGVDADSAGESPEYDASAAAVFGPFTGTINDYVRKELKFDDERVYEILTGKVHPWKYSSFAGRSPDASDTLRQTISAHRYLKVFVACGYYDLATPTSSVVYSIEHMRLPGELQKNITFGYYEGGHMMYIHGPSMKRLRGDLEKFYAAATNEAESE
jgi:carboxypeptidase C (cathepsin A)